MLKIGTQPAFVGDRKEGRVHTKETASRPSRSPGHVLGRAGEGAVPGVTVKVALER